MPLAQLPKPTPPLPGQVWSRTNSSFSAQGRQSFTVQSVEGDKVNVIFLKTGNLGMVSMNTFLKRQRGIRLEPSVS